MNQAEVMQKFATPEERRLFMIAARLCLGFRRMPWYDAHILNDFALARRFLAIVLPARLAEFEEQFAEFKVDPGFRTRMVPAIAGADEMAGFLADADAICAAGLKEGDRPVLGRGRGRANDQPAFRALHEGWAKWVADQVGEDIEPSYSMFVRYDRTGRLPVHLDSPDSKWALGLCLRSAVDCRCW